MWLFWCNVTKSLICHTQNSQSVYWAGWAPQALKYTLITGNQLLLMSASGVGSYFWRWGTWTCWHQLPHRCWPYTGRNRCRPPARVWSAANRCSVAGYEIHCSEEWAETGGRPHLVQAGRERIQDNFNRQHMPSKWEKRAYVFTLNDISNITLCVCLCVCVRTSIWPCVCVYRLDDKGCQI